ncbi:hypothetical protein AB1L88_15560 [Tautonia sp. JC769]|uniref:hypothetical protein n=1 Tax=Tautonia sp. JC769 TaxID=3232135 RepID=UPI003459E65A
MMGHSSGWTIGGAAGAATSGVLGLVTWVAAAVEPVQVPGPERGRAPALVAPGADPEVDAALDPLRTLQGVGGMLGGLAALIGASASIVLPSLKLHYDGERQKLKAENDLLKSQGQVERDLILDRLNAVKAERDKFRDAYLAVTAAPVLPKTDPDLQAPSPDPPEPPGLAAEGE